MGIEGLTLQSSLEQFYAGLSADLESALRRAAREVTGTLAECFRFQETIHDIHRRVVQALEDLHRIDRAWRTDAEDLDPEKVFLGVMRHMWFASGDSRQHARQVGFFSTQPCDLLPWVRWFLLVENYHRTDPSFHDRRLDRLRFLKSENPEAPCVTHEDVLLWLEHQLLIHENEPLSFIAQKCAAQLRHRLDSTLKPEVSLEAFCYLLLRCHQFCLAETMTEEDAARLQAVLGWRRFLSLTDLMLVVIQRVIEREPLPNAVSVLEGFMADGFHIRHGSFKDPYEADVVSPEETAQFDEAAIRVLTPIHELQGHLEEDCRSVSRRWHQQRVKVLDELLNEIRELQDMVLQPLPRKHLIAQSVRFFTSWSLAGWKNREDGPGALMDRVRAMFPERILKALVRQRRGYELATRKEWTQLLEKECRLQWDSYWKEPGSRTFGEADFRVWTRTQALALGPTPPLDAGTDAEEVHRILNTLADQVVRFKATLETETVSACLGGPVSFPTAGTPLEFVEHLRDMMPLEKVRLQAPSLQKLSLEEASAIHTQTLVRCAEAFYLWVVAERKRVQGDPLSLTVDQIPALASVMVPPWEKVAHDLARKAVHKFQDRAAPFYRRQKHSVCVDEDECGVHLAHFVVRELKTDVMAAAETGGLEPVRQAVLDESTRILAPRQVQWHMVPEKFLLQWAGFLDGRSGSDELVKALVSILPGMNCGACGESRCTGFALGLAQGRHHAAECVHLSPVHRERLVQILRTASAQAFSGNGFSSAYDLFKNPAAWRRLPKGHPLKLRISKVLDVKEQDVRRRVMDKAMTQWQSLASKPDVCKRPDMEAFYQGLVATIGYEATEKIQPEERQWLIRNGGMRLKKEWERLKNRTDWLTMERRLVAGAPSAQRDDPEIQAQRFYATVPYLHLLGKEDRRRLLAYRLERFEEGFFQWWNQDLLAMNHPQYRIDNWEEFSKVIKNAYWHQENFPAPRTVAEELLREMEHRGEKEVFFRDVLTAWIQPLGEVSTGKPSRGFLEDSEDSGEIQSLSQLKAHLERLCRDIMAHEEETGFGKTSPDMDRRLELAWKAFQRSNISFNENFTVSEAEGRESQWIRDRIRDVLEEQERERLLAEIVENAVASNRAQWLPAESVRAWIVNALRRGIQPSDILEKIFGWFQSFPQWKETLLLETLQKMVSLARWRYLVEAFSGVVLEGIPSTEVAWYEKTFPRWMKEVESAVRRYGDFDRERLLHYLFVLAKREGDLDVITALLREIRETSDVIEAAWLQFTNDRVTEPLPVPLSKGFGARYSLLVNRMKDLEPIRRCLQEGVPRGEKPDVVAAVRELQLYMRFHMVRHDAESMGADACFEAFWEEGYNLEGLSKEDLRLAFNREWQNRARWRQDRIWIMTMAVARRLASQSHELYEADKAFSKVRQGLLREEGMEEARDVIQRRGIALGTVKEAMYRELSEFLEKERMESFRTRIRQIVHELDRKRLRIVQAWYTGTVNRYSVFHLLRQYQKQTDSPSDEDFRDFFMEQWFQRIEHLRASDREDRRHRIREVDEGFQAILGVSPLVLEKEAEEESADAWNSWLRGSQEEIYRRLGGLSEYSQYQGF